MQIHIYIYVYLVTAGSFWICTRVIQSLNLSEMNFLLHSSTEWTKGIRGMWQAGRQITQKWHHFAGEMYSRICVEWASGHFDLGFTYIYPLLTKISLTKQFLHFCCQWPRRLKLAPPVTGIQHYISPIFAVLTAFQFRLRRRQDIQTDSRMECNTKCGLVERVAPHSNLDEAGST